MKIFKITEKSKKICKTASNIPGALLVYALHRLSIDFLLDNPLILVSQYVDAGCVSVYSAFPPPTRESRKK